MRREDGVYGSGNEMWVRWMVEAEQRKREERIRRLRESRATRPGRRRDRAGRRPRGRA